MFTLSMRLRDTFTFEFVENLSKKHVVNTQLCLIWINLANLLQIFKKNNIFTKRSKLTKAYTVVWCWENMSSAVGRIYECQGHLLYFSKNMESQCCLLWMYGIFCIKYFQEQSKSWERCQCWVLLFRRNHKQRKFAFYMTWLTPIELLKPPSWSLKIGQNQNCK